MILATMAQNPSFCVDLTLDSDDEDGKPEQQTKPNGSNSGTQRAAISAEPESNIPETGRKRANSNVTRIVSNVQLEIPKSSMKCDEEEQLDDSILLFSFKERMKTTTSKVNGHALSTASASAEKLSAIAAEKVADEPHHAKAFDRSAPPTPLTSSLSPSSDSLRHVSAVSTSTNPSVLSPNISQSFRGMNVSSNSTRLPEEPTRDVSVRSSAVLSNLAQSASSSIMNGREGQPALSDLKFLVEPNSIRDLVQANSGADRNQVDQVQIVQNNHRLTSIESAKLGKQISSLDPDRNGTSKVHEGQNENEQGKRQKISEETITPSEEEDAPAESEEVSLNDSASEEMDKEEGMPDVLDQYLPSGINLNHSLQSFAAKLLPDIAALVTQCERAHADWIQLRINNIKSSLPSVANLNDSNILAKLQEIAADSKETLFEPDLNDAHDPDDAASVSSHDSVCAVCFGEGLLYLCDRCPRAFHGDCMDDLPPEEDNEQEKEEFICQVCLSEDFIEDDENEEENVRFVINTLDPLRQTRLQILQEVAHQGRQSTGSNAATVGESTSSDLNMNSITSSVTPPAAGTTISSGATSSMSDREGRTMQAFKQLVFAQDAEWERINRELEAEGKFEKSRSLFRAEKQVCSEFVRKQEELDQKRAAKKLAKSAAKAAIESAPLEPPENAAAIASAKETTENEGTAGSNHGLVGSSETAPIDEGREESDAAIRRLLAQNALAFTS